MIGALLGQRRRLRWQLFASHLTVVVITMLAVVASGVLLVGSWLLRQGEALREPALDAQVIAASVGNLVRRGAPESTVSLVLAALQDGGLQVASGPFEPGRGPHWGGPPPALRPDLQGLESLIVLMPDGRVYASSDAARFPPGAAPTPADGTWREIASRALAGERDAARLSVQPSAGQPVGAYPIFDQDGRRVVGAVVLAKRAALPRDPPFLVARAIAAIGVASLLVLTLSSVFVLIFSGLAAYLLARRLGRRLERLSLAAEGLARGDLAQRVPPGEPDEIGQLAQRFNLMADRLQCSMAALEVERDKAEQALRTKRELIANVSHELRTPLAIIRGHVESLAMNSGGESEKEPPPTHWAADYLEVIQREVDHLSRLIDDLFSLATAEAGALTLNLEPLAISEVAAEVAEALAPIGRRERQITVVSRLEPNLPPVLADRQRLNQVLGNLVRNALRYTPEGGLISLSAAWVDGRVEVAVADTGVGIPPDELPRIFERFYRVDPARERATGGAGLGLAIVRELVESMGGAVAVESRPGEGSRFSFILPVAGGRIADDERRTTIGSGEWPVSDAPAGARAATAGRRQADES